MKDKQYKACDKHFFAWSERKDCDICNLERQLKEAQKIINTLDKQLSEVKAENTRLNDEYNRYIKNSDEIINNAGDKLRELYAENARLTKELAEAKAELDRLRLHGREYPNSVNRNDAELISMLIKEGSGAANETLLNLRDGLRRLEWSPIGTYVLTDCCPACGGHKDKRSPEYEKYSPAGHKPDCWLDALLKEGK